jgi:hypothetical protein
VISFEPSCDPIVTAIFRVLYANYGVESIFENKLDSLDKKKRTQYREPIHFNRHEGSA